MHWAVSHGETISGYITAMPVYFMLSPRKLPSWKLLWRSLLLPLLPGPFLSHKMVTNNDELSLKFWCLMLWFKIPITMSRCWVEDPLIPAPMTTTLTMASFSPGFESSWSQCQREKMTTMTMSTRNPGARQVYSQFFNPSLVWGRKARLTYQNSLFNVWC